MSTQRITQEAMALPIAERVVLAQLLWDSIHGVIDDGDLDETLYQELKTRMEAPLSDFVALDMEEIIQQAKLRKAAGGGE